MPTENEEKRELLKLKQGLIEESDIIETDVHEQPEELKGLAKFENFMYHNKWYIIVGLFFIIVGGFMIYQLLSKEAPDIRVLVVTSNVENTPDLYRKTHDIELGLEQYCPDYDQNGNIHVEVYYIDLTKSVDTYYVTSNTAKFFGEIERGTAQLIICDKGIFSNEFEDEQRAEEEFNSMFTDLGEALGDDSLKGQKSVKVKDTPLAAAANYENSVPDILVMGIKNEAPGMISYSDSALKNNAEAREVLKNILSDNKINEPKES